MSVDTKEAMDAWMRLAERETGLTRAQLLAMAEDPEYSATPKQPERSWGELMRSRGVPERHLVSLDSLVECPALEAVKKFFYNDKTVLVLSGGEGTRKSGSAAWALGQMSGMFLTSSRYIQLVNSKREDEMEALERAEGSDLIVLDDLGTEYHSEAGWAAARIGNLFQMRYDTKQKIIVTTNLGPDEFIWRYGTRTMGRIRECGTWVGVGTESVRK